MDGRGTMRSDAIAFDHFMMGSNCSGFVAIEQMTEVRMPALSMEVSNEATVPSRKAFTPPPCSSWLMARAAMASGKAWAWKSIIAVVIAPHAHGGLGTAVEQNTVVNLSHRE